MSTIDTIGTYQTTQQCNRVSAPVKGQTTETSVWAKDKELVEAVAKHIPRKPDGSLDIKTAEELSILDLLEFANKALAGMVGAKTTEERKRFEKEYKAFDNLLQKREEDDMKSDIYKNILNFKKEPPRHK